MPFADYDTFDACVSENGDKDDPEAYCAAIKREVEGESALSEEEAEHYSRLQAPDAAHRFLQANFDNLDVVRREQEGDDVRYKNLVLIGAGEWTDAFGNTEYYTEQALQRIAADPETFVEANHVDVNHEYQDQLLQVGHIDPDTLGYQNGLLLGDIVIYGDKTAGKDIIADMDRALESDGQNGAGGFSVEIPEEGLQRRFNSERGLYELTQFKLAGGAIVTQGASGPANFDQQFDERAVAMAEGGDDVPVRVLSPGDNTLSGMRQAGSMDAINDLETLDDYTTDDDGTELLLTADSDEPHLLADGETVSIDIEGASIDDIREALSPEANTPGEGRDMQGEADVAAAVDEFLANEGSPEDGVDAFLEWVRANTDADIDAVEAVAADYLAESGAETLSETPVSEFMAYLEEQAGGGEEEEPEDGEPGEDMGGDEMEEELAAKVEELERKLAEKEENEEDLKRRLEALEDEPAVPLNQSGSDESEEAVPPDEVGRATRDGDWISR